MRRAKHADRKQETRAKILIGEAAMRAGVFTMPVDEIEAVLAHYAETGGTKELNDFVRQRLAPTAQTVENSEQSAAVTAKGGSAATRQGGAEIEPLVPTVRSESVLQ